MSPKCDRCGEQDAISYHRWNRGIWIVYICDKCVAAVQSPPVNRACPEHHSTSCGCAALTVTAHPTGETGEAGT